LRITLIDSSFREASRPSLVHQWEFSICISAIGDTVAAVVGRRIGSRRIIRLKTVEGFAAGLTASFLAASLLLSPFIGLIGAAGAMFMELLDVPDDKLTMPVAAGALMTLATLALHQ